MFGLNPGLIRIRLKQNIQAYLYNITYKHAIVAVKLIWMITHNTYIIARDDLYAHGMSIARGV